MPQAIEDLVRDIYLHFAHSTKQISEYENIQHFAQTEPQKLLKQHKQDGSHFSQWPALELYFEKSAESDRLISSIDDDIFKSSVFFC